MKIQKLWADLETFSETPIKNGTYRYAEDSEIMLFLYAFDDGEVQCWDLTTGDPMPKDLEWALLHSDCEKWFHNCVTGDHEVRTPEGWVRFDELGPGTKVLQWCSKTQELTYTLPELTVNEYEGEMLAYNSLFHKGVYTPNHRIYFKTPYSNDWQVETAEQYAGRGPNSAKIPVSGFFQSPDDTVNLSTVESRLIEMIRADAHIASGRDRVQIKLRKQRKIDRASHLLKQAGWNFSTYLNRGDTIIDLEMHDRLSYLVGLLGRGKAKKLGSWVLQLPVLSRLAWLDEVQYWDGVKTNSAKRGGGSRAATLLTSSKKEDVYWLSEMAIQTGMNSSFRYDTKNSRGFSRPDGILHKLTIRPRDSVKTLYPPEIVHHQGKVYCVTVPTGAFLVRRNGATWVTGNSMFDRTVLRYNGYEVPLERVRDTMVQALCHALPGSLDTLCGIFGIAEEDAKLKDGRALIHLFCKPRPKNMKLRRATRETHPAEWARFIEYGKGDIRAMRALHYAMPKFNYPNGQSDELGNWHLDQKINDRGFRVDLDLVNAAISAVKLEKESLKQQGFDLTNGEVTSLTKRDQVLEHILMEYGIPLPDLTKATLERRINDPDIPRGVKELLALRLQATTTSTSKYVALLNSVNSDGRCRGTVQFAGAARTGRACLAEGTVVDVRTMTGEITQKPIEEVMLTDNVWDGENWVFHNGVVFSGYKDVVEHDGVRATSEHMVWVSRKEKITLSEAKARGVKLWKGQRVKKELTACELRRVLDYDSSTGLFTWRESRGSVVAGSVAGYVSKSNGYVYVKVFSTLYLAHRLAWLHINGEWPGPEVDHTNRIRSDNRIENLREANPNQNKHNYSKPITNTSGVKGVQLEKGRTRYRAMIYVNYKRKHLGMFDTLEAAAAAYAKASKELHGEYGCEG